MIARDLMTVERPLLIELAVELESPLAGKSHCPLGSSFPSRPISAGPTGSGTQQDMTGA